MPVTTDSPNHTHFPLPDHTSSSHASSTEGSSYYPESPIDSALSPISPQAFHFNFEPSKTPQLSEIGAVQGSSRADSQHKQFKGLLLRGAAGSALAHPLRETVESEETSVEQEMSEELAEEGMGDDDDVGEDEVQGENKGKDLVKVVSGGAVAEEDEDRIESNRLVIVIAFDDLCYQYLPKHVDGREVKFRTEVTPQNYKEHVFYLNRGWGTAEEIIIEIQAIDISGTSEEPIGPAIEPGVITALRRFKAAGSPVHIMASLPEVHRTNVVEFLQAYDITVGTGPDDAVVAIWTAAGESSSDSEIAEDRVDAADDAVEKKIARRLRPKLDMKRLWHINPSIIVASNKSNTEPVAATATHVGPQDPRYGAVMGGLKVPGINVLSFGQEATSEAPGRYDDLEQEMHAACYKGWAGVIRLVEGLQKQQMNGRVRNLDMSECVVKPRGWPNRCPR